MYLRPILGHIHSGGLRFKDNIEDAFKRQALMLNRSLRQLESIQLSGGTDGTSAPASDLLRALWNHARRELHYVSHFREPLEVDVGDIGFITGDPPKFTRVENVADKICDKKFPDSGVKKFRFNPKGRWTTEEVQGITRSVFHVRPFDTHLSDPDMRFICVTLMRWS